MIPAGLTQFSAGGRDYTVHGYAGTLLDHKKRSVTEVSGSGGGGSGYSYRGTGSSYTAPIKITSTTTTHDDVILQGDDGTEEAFQLLDFDLAARSGHALTVLWGVRSGRKAGPYFGVYNHNTRSHFIQKAALRTFAAPSILRTAIIFVVAFIVLYWMTGGFAWVLAPLATWVTYAIVRAIGAKRLESSLCAPLFQHLAAVEPVRNRDVAAGGGAA